MKIWAHRGCSQSCPENTLTAFSKAAALYDNGLTGIELDIQMTKDGKLVVIHDERIDRTTDGSGFVRDYTLQELQRFHIQTDGEQPERIPTMVEVLELLEDRLRGGMLLNIELKNSVYPYEGMEEIILQMVRDRGLEKAVIYSSFSARSVAKLRRLCPDARLGILASKASDCLRMLRDGCGADAIHPNWQGMDVPGDALPPLPVRAWSGGHLYPERSAGGRLDLKALEDRGITDVFLNEPEIYV